MAERVLALQRSAGNAAVSQLVSDRQAGIYDSDARTSNRGPTRVLQRSEDYDLVTQQWHKAMQAVEEAKQVAEDLIETAGGAGPLRPGGPERVRAPATRQAPTNWVKNELRRLGGGAPGTAAQEALDAIEELEKEEKALRKKLKGMKRPIKQRLPPKPPPASGTPTAGKTGEAVVKTAGKAEETATKTVTKMEEAGAGGLGKAGAKAEEAVAGAAAKRKLYKRLAEKLGKLSMELVDGLVPDPLDALELMYHFAGSYKEAWDRIKRDNVTSGFAVGLAAYLVVPRWEWVKHHALTTASRGVVTQVLGAVGIAENAFNEGLVRGFLYGEKHSPAQADKLRQQAFNALLKAERSAGRYEGDDVWTFGRDDVYTFAGALYPHAVSVLKDADRRRAARIESEKLREDMKRWSRVPIGADKY